MSIDGRSTTPTLVSSATEFVPGKFFTAKSGDALDQEKTTQENIGSVASYAGGMNSTASEWVPGQVTNSQGTATHLNAGQAGDVNSAQESLENLVEIHWNGQTFFVPQSLTYVAEDGSVMYMGPMESLMEDEGMQWAHSSHTLPAPPKRSLQTIGIPEPIREHFQTLDLISLKQMDPSDERYKELPMRYQAAYRLDDNTVTAAGLSSFGYPSSISKVVDQTDSQIYALRRFDNVRTSQTVITNALSNWRDVRHPGIVSLYNVFMEKGALFFAYMYHPGALTLKQRFVDKMGPLVSEALIWRLMIQLLSAVRLVHGRGCAMRVVDPAHIILTSGTNARFSCVGVLDVLEFESRKSVDGLQQEDLIKIGRVVLSLATRAVISHKNTDEALMLVKQHYSADLLRIATGLLAGKANITQVCNALSDRIHDELDTALAASDALHSHLRNEYENGRLLRLLFKLNTMVERPDHAFAPQWSETGDRYVLKLFRDYIFHQCDVEGLPSLDAGHVLTALNKLDTGDTEEIVLSSRDGKDLLVVTYADVQRCLETSFAELVQQAQMSTTASNTASSDSVAAPGVADGYGGGSGAHARVAHYQQFQMQQMQSHHQQHQQQHQPHSHGGNGGKGVDMQRLSRGAFSQPPPPPGPPPPQHQAHDAYQYIQQHQATVSPRAAGYGAHDSEAAAAYHHSSQQHHQHQQQQQHGRGGWADLAGDVGQQHHYQASREQQYPPLQQQQHYQQQQQQYPQQHQQQQEQEHYQQPAMHGGYTGGGGGGGGYSAAAGPYGYHGGGGGY